MPQIRVPTAAATLETVPQRNEPGETEAQRLTPPSSIPSGTAPVLAAAAKAAPVQASVPVSAASQITGGPPNETKARNGPSELRLQAIYYRFRGPTVVMNGKTLRVGDSVDGARVVSIQRTSVEVEQSGDYKTLTLRQD
jgi:MSHA biogenesis protein MshK